MRPQLPLMLTACIVFCESALVTKSNNGTLDQAVSSRVENEGELRENFRNLFDSIANSDSGQSKALETLKDEVTREQRAFNSMREELRTARKKNSFMRRRSEGENNLTRNNFMVAKRETLAGELTDDSDTDFRMAPKNKIIVDKTKFIPLLLNSEKKQMIMLRPYRFGKSFFLTTLAAFFEGRKDLFCERLGKPMDICNYSPWDWAKYPILYLNFATVATVGPQPLVQYVKMKVLALARKNNIFDIDKEDTFDNVMTDAFTRIHQNTGKNVVILADEYDLPVMLEYFDDVAESKSKEKEIGAIFHAMKSNAGRIQFAFVFGATKITTVGDTYNILRDLTREDTYSDLIGFTEHEIKEYYKNQLLAIARDRKLENSDALIEDIVKPFYNHYKFTRKGELVFSPLSVTRFLRENPEQPKSYWAEDVQLRPLLQNTVQKFSTTALDLLFEETIEVDMKVLNAKIDRRGIENGDSSELAKILFQAGFLSMKENEECSAGSCFLGVVNEEAKHILVDSLREKMMNGPLTVRKMETLLRNRQLTEFMGALDHAVEWLTGDKFFRLETKYQRVISFILREYTFGGSLSAFVECLIHTEYEIETKFVDYKKEFSDEKTSMTVMFYLKKQDQDKEYVDMTEETMKCMGTYAKLYDGKKKSNEEVLYVIISTYAGTKEGEPLENKLKGNPTKLKFIHNWAAFEWFSKNDTLQTYNLGLDDGSDDRTKRRLELIRRYDEPDQRKTPPLMVPPSFDPIADEIIQGYTEVISLEKFYAFIELCQKPETDAPKHVFEFTSNIKRLIELVEACLIKVSYVEDRKFYNRLKKIKEALKKMET